MAVDKLLVKFFASRCDVSDEQVVEVFHTWIQTKAIGGLLLDVADYTHVPNGPSVLLVGHEADCCLDRNEGPVGLLYNRKRDLSGDTDQARMQVALSDAKAAADKLDADLGDDFAIDGAQLRIIFGDRLGQPNDDATFAALKDDLAAAVQAVFGKPAELTRDTSDPRHRLTVNARF